VRESEICSNGSGDFWCIEGKKRECEKVEFMKDEKGVAYS